MQKGSKIRVEKSVRVADIDYKSKEGYLTKFKTPAVNPTRWKVDFGGGLKCYIATAYMKVINAEGTREGFAEPAPRYIPVRMVLPPNWVAKVDDKTKRVYYANTKTKKHNGQNQRT
eukprot:UN00644